MKTYTGEATINIKAPAAEVWKALTTPEDVKQYLFGTHVKSDWKEGSEISYEGEYEGKKYKDKGQIKKVEKNRLLQSTYWSSMSGKEDKPENYALLSYILNERNGGTELTVRQENIQSQQEMEHSRQNWQMVLQKLKELVEGR